MTKDTRLGRMEHMLNLAKFAVKVRYDPLLFAEKAWPWGIKGTPLENEDIRVWQSEVLDEIAQHLQNPETRHSLLRIAVASGHGIGKAQSLGMMLHTPDGLRRWGDLRPGDRVFGRDGQPTRVVAVHDRGERLLYRVRFDDGSETLACGDHLWTVRGRQQRRKGEGWVTMSTSEIMAAGVKRSNGKAKARQFELPCHEAVEFPERELPIHPYTLGVWLGDGGRNSGRVTSTDQEVVDHLREVGESVARQHGVSWGVEGLYPKLKAMGVVSSYSYQKHVPTEYMEAPSWARAELLRGLLDTDGECALHGSVVFSSASEALARDVIWLARSLGGKARMQPTTKMPTYRGPDGELLQGLPCHRVTLTLPPGVAPFYIARKLDRVRTVQQRYLARWIDSIEPAGVEPCMCITVEAEDSLYLANDFIVTHNSATMGMLATWALTCFDRPRILMTANTEGQLRTKTSPEIGQWVNSSLYADLFEVDTLSIKLKDNPDQHRLDLTPWSLSNTDAFQGLHAKGRLVMVMMDEAAGIPSEIWEVILGAFTDENTVLIWIAFGNPTQPVGAFRDCFRRDRHLWKTWNIDSRTVEGTNKQLAQQIVDKYGEDSDVARRRVRGLFPRTSSRQMVPEYLVDQAMERHLRKDQYDFAPKILTCDPAWTGEDELVIGLRQGLTFRILETMEKNRNDMEVGARLANYEVQHDADAVFIDQGWGTGIFSYGQTIGREWRLIDFGGKASIEGYANRRAEMYQGIVDWLMAGGALPNDPKLREDLAGVQTKARPDGTILLMSKEDMRKEGLPSPDRADALALSFAEPVTKRAVPISKTLGRGTTGPDVKQTEYDPLAGL